MGFVARHWRGDYSLARAFWVNGVLLFIPALVLQLAVLFATRRMGIVTGLSYVWTLNAVSVTGFLFAGWQLVGIWNSAGHSLSNGRRFWPIATRLFIAVVVVVNVGFIMVKTIPDMQKIAAQEQH